jgi:hypothetical protein
MQPWFRAFPPPGDGRASAVLVAVGDRLSDVEVGTDVDYTADGRMTATWRPLEPQAAVWVGEASAAELAGDLTMRVRGSDGRRRPAVGRAAPPVAVPLPPGLADVAPAGTDLDVLTCAAMGFAPYAGGIPRDATPVLGGVQKVDLEYYGVAVARAKGGGYLVGSCPTLRPESATTVGGENPQGFVVPAPQGGPDDLFALLPSTWTEARADEAAPGGVSLGQQHPAVVVVAPVGASEVEVAGKTVPVRDRLAVVRDVPEEGVTAVARDAGGRELGRTGLARTLREVASASFFDVS